MLVDMPTQDIPHYGLKTAIDFAGQTPSTLQPSKLLQEFKYVCPCRQNHDFYGYHRLNCKQNAGRANKAAHDLVQLALKKEFQRLGLRVVDNDNEMQKQYAHLSSQKRGDLAILSAPNFHIYEITIQLAVNHESKL
jgi:hypothetical protein